MEDYEINQIIQLAVSYKHQGLLEEPLALEEGCLKRCLSDGTTSGNGFGILYKALAKMYYLNGKYSLAKQFYIKAIEYLLPINPGDAQSCLFHLGCCSDNFIGSRLAALYYQVLNKGGIAPGAPGSPISMAEVFKLTNQGMEIFNNRDNVPYETYGTYGPSVR